MMKRFAYGNTKDHMMLQIEWNGGVLHCYLPIFSHVRLYYYNHHPLIELHIQNGVFIYVVQ